jgi:DNA-directed RNA polymerase specialized sigma24 family protein
LNIDKKEMAHAWRNRKDPAKMQEFMGYLEQMGYYMCKKFGIHTYFRDEYVQEAVITAIKAMRKYRATQSNPFSYFYKVIYTAFTYLMRREKQKRDKAPNVCSYDVIAASVGDDFDIPMENGENYVSIDGKPYLKDVAIRAAQEAQRIAKTVLQLGANSIAAEHMLKDVDDELTMKAINVILEKKAGRKRRSQAKALTKKTAALKQRGKR